MSVEELEKAVSKLTPSELAKFSDWFEQFQAAEFDRRIAEDAANGKLDRLGDQAIQDFRKGAAREL